MPVRPKHIRKPWREVLADAGYPTDVVVLDFETYYDAEYSMRRDDISTIEYIMDARFEELGVATLEVIDGQACDPVWHNGEDGVADALDALLEGYGAELEGCTLVIQNARFDGSVLAYRHGLVPRYVVDVMGLARHWDARDRHGLDRLAERFGFRAKGDTSRFKGWTNRERYVIPKGRGKGPKHPVVVPTMTPEQQAELGEYACDDVYSEFQAFEHLLPRLSTPTTELRVMSHTLRLYWMPQLCVDEEKAESIKARMRERLAAALEPTGLTEDEVRGGGWDELVADALAAWDNEWGDGDWFQRYTKKAKNCKRGWKIACAKDDPQREELEEHPDETVRNLMAAKSAVSSWPNHIKRVDRIVNQCRAAGGRMPIPLNYCKANTGRWSGGEGWNPQNLGSRGDPLISEVRELLVAPPGRTLVICDAASIEARVLAWLAGQADVVETFRNGGDVYCMFAEKIFGHPVRKPRPGDPPPIAARLKKCRNDGKVGVLGGGYGMGAEKVAANKANGVTLEEAKRIIEAYRKGNPMIVQFWHDIERAFLYVATKGLPTSIRNGLIRLHSTDDCDVIITLPSGRELKYAHVRVKRGKYGPQASVYDATEHKWTHVYGGLLTENVVQAISRDILWQGIDGMERDGWPVVLHVHDELVACVPEECGEAALADALRHLSTTPDWAEGLPLGAEGVVSKRYGGH